MTACWACLARCAQSSQNFGGIPYLYIFRNTGALPFDGCSDRMLCVRKGPEFAVAVAQTEIVRRDFPSEGRVQAEVVKCVVERDVKWFEPMHFFHVAELRRIQRCEAAVHADIDEHGIAVQKEIIVEMNEDLVHDLELFIPLHENAEVPEPYDRLRSFQVDLDSEFEEVAKGARISQIEVVVISAPASSMGVESLIPSGKTFTMGSQPIKSGTMPFV